MSALVPPAHVVLKALVAVLLVEAGRLHRGLPGGLSFGAVDPDDLVQRVVEKLLIFVLRTGGWPCSPLAWSLKVMRREIIRLHDQATRQATGYGARRLRRAPTPTAQPVRVTGPPVCVEEVRCPRRPPMASERSCSSVLGWLQARDDARWPAPRGVDHWAVLLLQGRLLALERALVLHRREGLVEEEQELIERVERALPWTPEDGARRFAPGWPPVAELWLPAALAVLHRGACTGPLIVAALQRFAPRSAPLALNRWQRWLSRARAQGRARLGTRRWRDTFVRWGLAEVQRGR